MKTEDLKAQGLSDEQIAFVMAENGKDIKREKDRADGRNICGLVRNDSGKSYTLTDTKAAEGYKINKDSKTFEFNCHMIRQRLYKLTGGKQQLYSRGLSKRYRYGVCVNVTAENYCIFKQSV